MAGLPTGTVTFLFADIEGSTRLLQQVCDRHADVLAEYRRSPGAAGGNEPARPGLRRLKDLADAQ